MINSVNSSTNFGTMQFTTVKKFSNAGKETITKNMSRITDEKKESLIKQILNSYFIPQKKGNISEISEITSAKISKSIQMLTGLDIDPKNANTKILSKVNDNRFVFGNDSMACGGTKSIIDFNV